MIRNHRLGAIVLLSFLFVSIGCRPIETPEELQTLAGDLSQTPSPEEGGPPSTGSASAGGESLDSFPLVGSALPGLGGRLHTSLCDPGSDPYSTCI